VVKVQTDRGHAIATTGPYAVVRHPMYAGAIPFLLGIPLLLGSWYGLALAPALVAAFAVRAVLEERTLAAQLPAYADYAARVRYRLVPLIW
jgi:protein-S-isoprenylcysteine O-methyltransferase Ste14